MEAAGSRANSVITPIMYAAGGHASHATRCPGRTREARAAPAAAAATARNAGTANRFASGAASETWWKLTAAMGMVNAMAASDTALVSMTIRVGGKPRTAGQRETASSIQVLSSGARMIRPTTAAKLSGYATKQLRLLRPDRFQPE